MHTHKGKWKAGERMENSSDLWDDLELAEVFEIRHLKAFLVVSATPALWVLWAQLRMGQ